MAFKERYYEKYDIFSIDGSGQQCMVVSRPIRKADNYWVVSVRLIDNDYSSVLDETVCQKGDTTRFISNAVPELHKILCPILVKEFWKIFLIAGRLN